MKIGFFGTPEHSRLLLEKLIGAGITVAFVVTNPDKPQGRKKIPTPSPVKALAVENDIPVIQPLKLRSQEAIDTILKYEVDLNVVYAYGSIIPEEIFSAPKRGSINLHGSVLPEYRGASPVQTAILDGKKTTGYSIQYVAREVDSGDVLVSETFSIENNDTTGSLLERITDLGGKAILGLLNSSQFPKAIPQDHSKATHCRKIHAEDRVLDFNMPAVSVHNRVRALYPNPVSYTHFRDKRINILKTSLDFTPDIPEEIAVRVKERLPGMILKPNKKSLFVICGDKKMISIEELQPEGKKPMKIQDFLNGLMINEGECFV